MEKNVLVALVEESEKLQERQENAIKEYVKENKSLFAEKIFYDTTNGEYKFTDGRDHNEIYQYRYASVESGYDYFKDVRVFGFTYSETYNQVEVWYVNDEGEIDSSRLGDFATKSYNALVQVLTMCEVYDVPEEECEEDEDDDEEEDDDEDFFGDEYYH